MAEAEVGGLDDDDEDGLSLDEDVLNQSDREGLTDFSNLDIFLLWYQMGGSEHGLSISEISTMSASMVKDFLYLLGKLSKKKKKFRKQKERMDKIRGDKDD